MSASPPTPFKKTCPWTILPSTFYNFSDCPLWGRYIIRIYSPSFTKKGGLSYGRHYFDKYSSELAQLVPVPFSWGRSTHYSDRLYDFSVNIPKWYKDVYVNSFFARTARPWNSLPIECFPFTYDLSGLKSGINRHLLTVGSF